MFLEFLPTSIRSLYLSPLPLYNYCITTQTSHSGILRPCQTTVWLSPSTFHVTGAVAVAMGSYIQNHTGRGRRPKEGRSTDHSEACRCLTKSDKVEKVKCKGL